MHGIKFHILLSVRKPVVDYYIRKCFDNIENMYIQMRNVMTMCVRMRAHVCVCVCAIVITVYRIAHKYCS